MRSKALVRRKANYSDIDNDRGYLRYGYSMYIPRGAEKRKNKKQEEHLFWSLK